MKVKTPKNNEKPFSEIPAILNLIEKENKSPINDRKKMSRFKANKYKQRNIHMDLKKIQPTIYKNGINRYANNSDVKTS